MEMMGWSPLSSQFLFSALAFPFSCLRAARPFHPPSTRERGVKWPWDGLFADLDAEILEVIR